MPETFVIIGASLAGSTAAITLRDEGFAGKIMLIGAEPHPPYERPPLSKKYLQGEKLPEEIADGWLIANQFCLRRRGDWR